MVRTVRLFLAGTASHQIAWAGALLVTITILTVNILARYISTTDYDSH